MEGIIFRVLSMLYVAHVCCYNKTCTSKGQIFEQLVSSSWGYLGRLWIMQEEDACSRVLQPGPTSSSSDTSCMTKCLLPDQHTAPHHCSTIQLHLSFLNFKFLRSMLKQILSLLVTTFLPAIKNRVNSLNLFLYHYK